MKNVIRSGDWTRWGKVMLRLALLVSAGFPAGCATKSNGEKESVGQTLQRMDQSVENMISRMQDRTYDE